MKAVFFVEVPQRLAGAQKSLLAALQHVAAHGIDPLVVVPQTGPFTRACEDAGLAVRVLAGPPSFAVFGKALLHKSPFDLGKLLALEVAPYAAKLARLLRGERAEVVHFNTARGILLAGWGAHLAGLPTVLHQRGGVAIGRVPWVVAQALADRIVLVAAALERDLAPIVRPRAVVVHNGVAVVPRLARDEALARLAREPAFAEHIAPTIFGRDDGSRSAPFAPSSIFVSLSTPTPFKGLHHLVDAAARAKAAGTRATYLFAGTSPDAAYLAWLRHRIDAAGLGADVHLLGHVTDVHALLTIATALILPTVDREIIEIDGQIRDETSNEGLPRSVLEAMLAGTAVIASDVAGVREQVTPDVTGVVVPAADIAALAEAISKLSLDPSRSNAMGDRGREVVTAKFKVQDAAAGLAKALRDAAHDPPSRAARALRLTREIGGSFASISR